MPSLPSPFGEGLGVGLTRGWNNSNNFFARLSHFVNCKGRAMGHGKHGCKQHGFSQILNRKTRFYRCESVLLASVFSVSHRANTDITRILTGCGLTDNSVQAIGFYFSNIAGKGDLQKISLLFINTKPFH